MLASVIGPLILIFLAMILGLLILVAVGAYFLFRWIRFHYRMVKEHTITKTITTTATVIDARWAGGRETGGIGRRRSGSWSPTRARRQMWHSVKAAEEAVAAARDADASMGELPHLCANLRQVASNLDGVLRAQTSSAATQMKATAEAYSAPQLLQQVHEVRRAASDIQVAAVNVATDAHSPRVNALLHDAAVELQCVRAGLDAVHRTRA